MVTAPPDPQKKDAGWFYDAGIWFALNYYVVNWWYYDDGSQEWLDAESGDVVFLINLQVVEGSGTVDPSGNSTARKRKLRFSTDPPYPNLAIQAITVSRLSGYSYGHSHSPSGTTNCLGTLGATSGQTDTRGIFDFYYTGSEAAGVIAVNVEHEDPNNQYSTESCTAIFDVKHLGLVQFTGGTGILLVPPTGTHPSPYWGVSALNSLIAALGSAFYAEYNQLLLANDMSLQYGGLFDHQANWSTPHNEHRVGNCADVDIYPESSEKWTFIKDFVDTWPHGNADYYDGHPTHLHVRADRTIHW